MVNNCLSEMSGEDKAAIVLNTIPMAVLFIATLVLLNPGPHKNPILDMEVILALNNDTIVVIGNPSKFSIYVNDTLACSSCIVGTKIPLSGSLVRVKVTDGRRIFNYTLQFDEKRRVYYIAQRSPTAVVVFSDVYDP